MNDIVHTLDIATTPDRLYEALTSQDGLASWWTPRAKATPTVGAVNEFGFGPEMTLSVRVDALDPARRVVWSCMQVPPDWNGTRIEFDILPQDGSTLLRFSHSGFAPDYEQLSIFNYLWAQNLRSLKLFLETGTGEPHGAPASTIGH